MNYHIMYHRFESLVLNRGMPVLYIIRHGCVVIKRGRGGREEDDVETNGASGTALGLLFLVDKIDQAVRIR